MSTLPTTLFLVRHAETEANVGAVWHGSFDAPLTPRGRRQVEATAQAFAALAAEAPFHALYSSPLGRAVAMADAIARAAAPSPPHAAPWLRIDPALSEFSIGDWEGRTFEDLQRVERLWERWAADPEFRPPNGESPASFNRRARAALQAIVAAHPGQRVIVVSHNGLISSVLATWTGQGPDDWRRFEVHNGAISILHGAGSSWRLLRFNDHAHLPPDLVAHHDSAAWNG